MKTIALLTLFSFAAFASELDTNLSKLKASVESEVTKLRTEREAALKPLRATLLKNLESEVKQWQAAGKLDLILAYDARKAELDAFFEALKNPLFEVVYMNEIPIAGSKAEDQYRASQKAVYAGFNPRLAKLKAQVDSLSAVQKSLVQQGKKDDALRVSDFQVELNDIVEECRIDFSAELIVYDRWYRRGDTNDFVRFRRGTACNQTYGPDAKGESDYTYKIAGNVITITRGPSRPQPLVLKVVNIRSFEDGWKLVSESEIRKVRGQ